MTRSALCRSRRIVIKVGTSLLAPPERPIQARRFSALAREIAALREAQLEPILVSSGAVGLGLRRLGRSQRPRTIPEKQAAAAVGQIDLCQRFQKALGRFDLKVGQILLTHIGLAQRERFLNARHTIQQLVRAGVVPIINENDSVATEELRFGDNDHLSALVTNLAGADLLILLTDIDGLYDRHPKQPGARPIRELSSVTPELIRQVSDSTSLVGTGGMRSKLAAARTAAHFGATTVIANGRQKDVISRILAGEPLGTCVQPQPTSGQISARKHWIAYSLKPRGTLHLDAGAARALVERGRSLLPIGIVSLEGQFGVGDLVRCCSPQNIEIARGLISYTAAEVERIKGQKSPRIATLLGYTNGPEIIHRDDLVLLRDEG